MTLTPFLIIAVVALAIGVAVQYLIPRTYGFEWLVVALGLTFGAYFFSQALPGSALFEGIKEWGPVYEGFYLIPGIVGGALIALIVDLGVRMTQPMATSAT